MANRNQNTNHLNSSQSSAKGKMTISKYDNLMQIKPAYCSVAFYEIPHFQENRQMIFGSNNISDDVYKQFLGPDRYQLKSQIDANKEKQKGCSFRLGRDLTRFNSTKPLPTPGPGSYQIDKNERNTFYTIRTRTINHETLTSNRFNPGPGSYSYQTMNPEGTYYISKYQGTKAAIFAPDISNRFRQSCVYKIKNGIPVLDNKSMSMPGSGQYEVEQINKNGKYKNSKLKSAQGGKWSTSDRFVQQRSKLKTPGPGNYKITSTFNETKSKQKLNAKPLQKIQENVSQKQQNSLNVINQDKTLIFTNLEQN